MVSPNTTSRFIRACLRQPVDRTPVWFLRQAGRYMPEYMAVRKHHSLLEICRTPSIAAEVTITAAERLGVDAAIIFADLLLPLTPMGLDFEFVNGEGPVIHQPLRTLDQIRALRTDRTQELSYVAEAITRVATHFNNKRPASSDPAESMDTLGIIGFCGAPFTLASYMIEGGSSRNYIETKKLMYACGTATNPGAPHLDSEMWARAGDASWPLLMDKLLTVLTDFAAQQVAAGADVIQVFDSWAGALSVPDYRAYALAPTTELIRRIQALGVPVIYFGVDTASLLPTFRELGADVIGLDWRIPLDAGWRALGLRPDGTAPTAVQGNLDPITLFAPDAILEARVLEILSLAAGRPGHIFNLGHGIVPNTPVDSVLRVVDLIKRHGQQSGCPTLDAQSAAGWGVAR
ncbi:MAG TPA: uroporphyrinogen decarboxylase [Acidobacteriaceae bacterium]|nr:uroporphyrinogen decarboxylase [Acidobacteriaceae bacterium]